MITFHVKNNAQVLVKSTEDLSAGQLCSVLGISKAMKKTLILPDGLKKGRWSMIGVRSAEKPVSGAPAPEIVYEDETCLVARKPSGILIHGDGSGAETLEERVDTYLCETGFPFCAKACHRLDVETQGLVLFCKIPFLQNFYDEQFRSQTVFKEYYLVVSGNVGWKRKTIDAPIGRDRHDAKKMIVFSKGKEARTIFTNLGPKGANTLLKARIIHGRKHQIRVHSAYGGFPIVNDELYNSRRKEGSLLLQCFHLAFVSAQGQKKTDVEIDLSL